MSELKGIISFFQDLSLWQKLGLGLCFLPLLFLYLLYSQPEDSMVPLASKLSPKKLRSKLTSHGIRGQIKDDIYWIPRSQQGKAKKLLKAEKEPKRDSWVFQDSFFESRWKGKLKAHYVLERKLEKMLLSIPSVKKAMIQITPPEKKIFTEENRGAKAAVTVYLKSGRSRLNYEEVQAISYTVASGVSGLQPERVSILAHGHFYSLQNLTPLDRQQYLEEYYQEKLERALSSLSVINLSVTIDQTTPPAQPNSARIIIIVPEIPKEGREKKEAFYERLAKNLLSPLKISHFELVWMPPKKIAPPHMEKNSSHENYPLALALILLLLLLFGLYQIPKKMGQKESDWEMANETWDKIGSFEDLKLLPDRVLEAALLEVNKELLGLALKVAPPQIKKKIFRNLDESDRQLLKEEMQTLGPVRLSNVESAQEEILNTIRKVWSKK